MRGPLSRMVGFGYCPARVTQRTVYKLIDTGELTAFKIGRTIRLREQDLQEYLDRSRIQPGDLSHLYPEESGAV